MPPARTVYADDVQHRLAERVEVDVDPEARPRRRLLRAVRPRRQPGAVVDVDPHVEVARVHPQALGGAEADVHDRRRDEARAARVLDRHLDAELDGDVADQQRPA